MPLPTDLASGYAALQLGRAPRPLPLFLEQVRRAAITDPALARAALAGLSAYSAAPKPPPRDRLAVVARICGATLRACGGGGGPPLIIIPSLINPPDILDLDPPSSLAASLVGSGYQVLLLDWGLATGRRGLSVGDHVEQLLVPLIRAVGEPPILIGYCLGGTMSIAAAGLVTVKRIATLAAPWHFAAYPPAARAALDALWQGAQPACERWQMLPMELLQAGFWALDPDRLVAKFARFASLAPDSAAARRFVALEDWANRGEPLPLAAARELFEDLFAQDRTGRGEWVVGGQRIAERPAVPSLAVSARNDRIVPLASAPAGGGFPVDLGHVGMIVGRRSKELVHDPLCAWLHR